MSDRTLIQPVIERARQNPDHPTLVMIDQQGGETRVTAGEFHRQASDYANTLQQAGVGPEDLVVLVLKQINLK